MALTQVNTQGITDATVANADLANEAVNEAKIQISNAGTNGQYLQKQSGNTGGLTWATVAGAPEGTAVLSTGESGGTKFLREDGDGTSSWQTVSTAEQDASTGDYTLTSGDLKFATDVKGIRFNGNSSTGYIVADTTGSNAIWCNVGGNLNSWSWRFGGTEKFTFNSTGNIAFASGNGIDFSATADSSATNASTSSELLDDYEEGSWEPTAYSGATGMSHFGSHYTRIGDMCFLVGYIHAISGATNSAVFKIGGLPFSVNTADEYPGSCALHTSSFTTGSSLFVTAVVEGQQVKFMGTKENQGWYQLVGSDNIKNNNTIMFNIAYKCA